MYLPDECVHPLFAKACLPTCQACAGSDRYGTSCSVAQSRMTGGTELCRRTGLDRGKTVTFLSCARVGFVQDRIASSRVEAV